MVENENNRRVNRRQEMAEGMNIPEAMGNEFTRGIGDRVVDVEAYLNSPQFQDHAIAAALLGGATGLGWYWCCLLLGRTQRPADGLSAD